MRKMFPSYFLAQTFLISFLVWFQLKPERHTGCLRSQPRFIPSFVARGKLDLLIESQRVDKIVLRDTFSSKSTITQPLHAVSGLKDIPKQF